MIYKINDHADVQIPENPQKIVSMAPAITETLFALGLGNSIAGVTQYCSYPPEAAQKPTVAGFREVNLEALAGVNPDLVILPYDMSHFKNEIEALGIPVVLFDFKSLASFLKDVEKIGALCGKKHEAQELVKKFRDSIVTNTTKEKPAVLFVVLNPDEFNAPVSELTIIGADNFYNDVIEAAGGQNAYKGNIPFPRVSLEAVIEMNADFIVLGAPELADTAQLEKLWRKIANLKGAGEQRLIILNEASDTIPGPRTLNTIRKLSPFMGAKQ